MLRGEFQTLDGTLKVPKIPSKQGINLDNDDGLLPYQLLNAFLDLNVNGECLQARSSGSQFGT